MAIVGHRERRHTPPKGHAAVGMAYAVFLRSVAEEGGFDPDLAEDYLVAVISTLEARLSFKEVSGLEAELPYMLREILHNEPILDLPAMDERELFARVRDRLGVTREEAENITRSVLRALRSHLSGDEIESVEAQLSPGLRALWRS